MTKEIDDYWPVYGWGRCRFCKEQCNDILSRKYWQNTHFTKAKSYYRSWEKLCCKKRKSSLYWIVVEKIQKNREKFNLNGFPQDMIYNCDPC